MNHSLISGCFKCRYNTIRIVLLTVSIFLIHLQPLCCYSQNKTLTLHFPSPENEKKITLYYSILGKINYMYEPYIHKYKTNNKELSIVIPDSLTSFLMSIDSDPVYNWGFNVNIYMDREERLDIYLDTVLPPRFHGDNAGLHDFMFRLKNGAGYKRSDNTLQDFLEDESTCSFFDFIDNRIKSCTYTVDSLYKNEKINPSFYNYAKGLVIDDYLFRAGLLASITDEKYIHKKVYLPKTDSVTFFSDIDRLYKKYTAIQTDGICLDRKASLRAMNLIPGEALDLGVDEVKAYKFLNREEQEIMVASEIILNASTGKLDSVCLTAKVSNFKQVFPDSRYVPVLESLKPLEEKGYLFARFSDTDGFSEFGQLKVNNLTDITKMFLGRKPVFIDFWATWCSPCLNEFKFREELDLFLKENNIAVMYVSLDFGGNYNKWKETIIENQLEGFHYLATPELGQQLPYFKESSVIPRFILLDENGDVVIDKCEFPSSGKLIPQIKEKLGH